MASDSLTPQDLWLTVVDIVKDRTKSVTFWETLEKVTGIIVENDTLVIGLDPRYANQAGHLQVSEHRNAIDRAIEKVAGRPLKVRLIEGDSLGDWEAAKRRDERVSAMREASYDRRDKRAADSQSWDALYEYVARQWSSVTLRALPQSKARYLSEMLYVVVDAMDQLYRETTDENIERLLARVIDRISTNADVPATLVALEVERLRAWRKSLS